MKTTAKIIFVALSLLLLCSCNKNIQDGGERFYVIYTLDDGEMNRADGKTIDVPAEGSSYELEIVSYYGITEFTIMKECAGIEAELEDSVDESREYIVNGDYYWQVYTYKVQTVRISAEDNDGKSRSMKFRLYTPYLDGDYADITVTQSGR